MVSLIYSKFASLENRSVKSLSHERMTELLFSTLLPLFHSQNQTHLSPVLQILRQSQPSSHTRFRCGPSFLHSLIDDLS